MHLISVQPKLHNKKSPTLNPPLYKDMTEQTDSTCFTLFTSSTIQVKSSEPIPMRRLAERFPLYKDMTDVIREVIAKTPRLFVLRPEKLKTPYGMAMQAAVI